MSKEIKKAITSEAAPAENGPENDTQLNAENAPSIQDAKAPGDSAEPAKVEQQELPEGLDIAAQGGEVEDLTEEKKEASKEVSFGNFFGDTKYTLGATLEQGPSGNVMANMKPSQSNYVEQAKNSKNIILTEEDFADKKE